MATIFLGMCHTFSYKNKDEEKDESTNTFLLDPNLNYRILIHDPNYYHILFKSVVPRIWVDYKAGKNMEAGTYDYHEIIVTEHQLLNRPEQPCEMKEDYNFLECVKTSQARMVGCRPPWDIWSPPSIPLCQTMHQLHIHEKIDLKYYSLERKRIVQSTGCKVPCKYKVCQFNYSDS